MRIRFLCGGIRLAVWATARFGGCYLPRTGKVLMLEAKEGRHMRSNLRIELVLISLAAVTPVFCASRFAMIKPVNVKNDDGTYSGKAGTGRFSYTTLWRDAYFPVGNNPNDSGGGRHAAVDIGVPSGTSLYAVSDAYVYPQMSYSFHLDPENNGFNRGWGGTAVLTIQLGGETIHINESHMKEYNAELLAKVQSCRSEGIDARIFVPMGFCLGKTGGNREDPMRGNSGYYDSEGTPRGDHLHHGIAKNSAPSTPYFPSWPEWLSTVHARSHFGMGNVKPSPANVPDSYHYYEQHYKASEAAFGSPGWQDLINEDWNQTRIRQGLPPVDAQGEELIIPPQNEQEYEETVPPIAHYTYNPMDLIQKHLVEVGEYDNGSVNQAIEACWELNGKYVTVGMVVPDNQHLSSRNPPFVHRWEINDYSFDIQNFAGGTWDRCAIVHRPGSPTAFSLHGAFWWWFWLSKIAHGLPITDEFHWTDDEGWLRSKGHSEAASNHGYTCQLFQDDQDRVWAFFWKTEPELWPGDHQIWIETDLPPDLLADAKERYDYDQEVPPAPYGRGGPGYQPVDATAGELTLVAELSAHEVDLQWSDETGHSPMYYSVRRDGEEIAPVIGYRWGDREIEYNTRYVYQVISMTASDIPLAESGSVEVITGDPPALPPPEPSRPESIVMHLPMTEFRLVSTGYLTATVLDQYGEEMAGFPYHFRASDSGADVSDSDTLVVSSNGYYMANSMGEAEVWAQLNNDLYSHIRSSRVRVTVVDDLPHIPPGGNLSDSFSWHKSPMPESMKLNRTYEIFILFMNNTEVTLWDPELRIDSLDSDVVEIDVSSSSWGAERISSQHLRWNGSLAAETGRSFYLQLSPIAQPLDGKIYYTLKLNGRIRTVGGEWLDFAHNFDIPSEERRPTLDIPLAIIDGIKWWPQESYQQKGPGWSSQFWLEVMNVSDEPYAFEKLSVHVFRSVDDSFIASTSSFSETLQPGERVADNLQGVYLPSLGDYYAVARLRIDGVLHTLTQAIDPGQVQFPITVFDPDLFKCNLHCLSVFPVGGDSIYEDSDVTFEFLLGNNGNADCDGLITAAVIAPNGASRSVTFHGLRKGDVVRRWVTFGPFPSGEKEFRLVLDPNNAIEETNESDNSKVCAVTIKPLLPDLAVQLTCTPGSPTSQDSIQATAMVSNGGRAPSESCTLIITFDESVEQRESLPGLQPGATHESLFTFDSLSVGQHDIEVIVDGDYAVDESDETNNVDSHVLTVREPSGDANGDGTVDISDVVFILKYLFDQGPTPETPRLADANCDNMVDISDAVYILLYLFAQLPMPGC